MIRTPIPRPATAAGMQRSVRITLLLLLAASAPAPARAAALPAADYTATVVFNDPLRATAPDIFDARFGAVPQSTALDDSLHIVNRDEDPTDGVNLERRLDLQRVAQAETSAGARPQAIAAAEVNVSAMNFSVIETASAHASIRYFTQVTTRPDAGLVWRPTVVPVTFHALASTTGPATAVVLLEYVGSSEVLFVDSASGFPGSTRTEFDRNVALSIVPDQLLRVALDASVSASVLISDGAETSAGQAVADPTFSFDQRAFDLYALSIGQPTFDLGEHFAFEFSPTITASEPVIASEPLGIAAAGILAIGLLRRRRAG